MTPAEKALIDTCLSLQFDCNVAILEIIEPYVLAVREERLPSDLLEQTRKAEADWREAIKLHNALINDLKLNYPQELVEAARSRVKKEQDGHR